MGCDHPDHIWWWKETVDQLHRCEYLSCCELDFQRHIILKISSTYISTPTITQDLLSFWALSSLTPVHARKRTSWDSGQVRFEGYRILSRWPCHVLLSWWWIAGVYDLSCLQSIQDPRLGLHSWCSRDILTRPDRYELPSVLTNKRSHTLG